MSCCKFLQQLILSYLRELIASPQALHIPLPSVRLRLTASSPEGGRASAPSSEWRKGAFAPKLDNRAAALMVGGPPPPPSRSLGPVLAPLGCVAGPAGRAVAAGKGKGIFSSPGEKPTIGNSQVREAIAPEHSQGAPRTATVADDVKSLCPFERRGEGHTCITQVTVKQPIHGGALRIVPARRTKRAMKGI